MFRLGMDELLDSDDDDDEFFFLESDSKVALSSFISILIDVLFFSIRVELFRLFQFFEDRFMDVEIEIIKIVMSILDVDIEVREKVVICIQILEIDIEMQVVINMQVLEIDVDNSDYRRDRIVEENDILLKIIR